MISWPRADHSDGVVFPSEWLTNAIRTGNTLRPNGRECHSSKIEEMHSTPRKTVWIMCHCHLDGMATVRMTNAHESDGRSCMRRNFSRSHARLNGVGNAVRTGLPVRLDEAPRPQGLVGETSPFGKSPRGPSRPDDVGRPSELDWPVRMDRLRRPTGFGFSHWKNRPTASSVRIGVCPRPDLVSHPLVTYSVSFHLKTIF